MKIHINLLDCEEKVTPIRFATAVIDDMLFSAEEIDEISSYLHTYACFRKDEEQANQNKKKYIGFSSSDEEEENQSGS